jgi:hypothetical protein
MIRIGVRSFVSAGGGTDADAQAFITAAGITDATQQSAINTLVTDLKGYGVWSKMKAIYPFVGGTSSTHKWNLKDPRDLDAAFRLVFSGGWTHSSTGATPNGTNAYADTYLKLQTNISATSHAFGVYSRTNNTTGSQVWGSYDQATILFAQNNLTGANFVDGLIGALISYTANPTTGLILATRRSATDLQAYRNNVSLGTNTTNTTSVSNLNMYLAARNNTGAADLYSQHQLAFSFFSEGLTDTEASNLYTAVQAYQTTLGRSVGTQTVSDADAQAFVNAAVIEDQVQATAINTLVTDLKGYGVWSKMKAIYPFVGGTATTHKWNLKDPRDLDAAFRLVFFGGGSHSSNGYLPNGVNSYANTFYTPSTSGQLNSAHLSYYSRTDNTQTKCMMGSYDSLSANVRRHYFGQGLSICSLNSTLEGNYAPVNYFGHHLIKRENSSETKQIRNGITIVTSTIVSTGRPVVPVYIGAANLNNTSVQLYSALQCAFASIGDGLTDTEAANFYTAVQAYQTTLSRNV